MGLKSTTVCLGYRQLTTLSSAVGFTDIPQGATLALIVPESQNVRWRDDGTNPTASVGMPIFVGASLSYDGDFNKIKFIEESASAKINVSFYA